MSIEKLQRVLWRLRKRNKGITNIANYELRRAIMFECGTHPFTYRTTRKALLILKWIKSHKKHYFILTGNDLNET